jgi:hypothetical protein
MPGFARAHRQFGAEFAKKNSCGNGRRRFPAREQQQAITVARGETGFELTLVLIWLKRGRVTDRNCRS